MKLASLLLAGLSLGAAVTVLAGSAPQSWQTLRSAEQFKQLKPGDKIAYVCNQCKTVSEVTVESATQTMDHCKEGSTVTCPSCKKTYKVVLAGPPKFGTPVREVKYTNDKGDECLFIAKAVERK